MMCIVVEDCGESLKKPFKEHPEQVRFELAFELHDIHEYGYVPMDFAERNVVVKGDAYRIIDLQELKPHEGCDWNGQWREGEKRPHPFAFGCNIMYVLGLELNIWHFPIPFIRFHGAGFKNDLGEYPSQEVVDALLIDIPKRVSPENKEILHKWLKTAKTEGVSLDTVSDYLAKVGQPPYSPLYY